MRLELVIFFSCLFMTITAQRRSTHTRLPLMTTKMATVVPQSPPASSTGAFCSTASPFSWSNSLSWPLENATFQEPTGLTDVQLDTSTPANQAYIVAKHNCLRTKPFAKNMKAMQWNAEAAAQAQAWANNCVFAHNEGSQRKTSQFSCGQNLAMGTGMRLSWNKVINMWYNEVNGYTYSSSYSPSAGHYTQVVWANTYQIGCGYKNCGTMFFYVCNYCPAGNMMGSYPYQQGTACEACQNTCVNGKLCGP